MEALRKRRQDIRALTGVKIAAIGEKTSRALEDYGLFTDYTPPVFVAEALAQGLIERVQPGEKILIVRSDIGRPVLTEALTEHTRAQVEALTIYRTLPPDYAETAALTSQRYDVVTFSSASAVRHFFSLLETAGIKPIEGTIFACIGPVTAAALESYGYNAQIVAETYTSAGLTDAIIDYYSEGIIETG